MKFFILILSLVAFGSVGLAEEKGEMVKDEPVVEKSEDASSKDGAEKSTEGEDASEEEAEGEQEGEDGEVEYEEEDAYAHLKEKAFGFHLNLNVPFFIGYGLDFSLNEKFSFSIEKGGFTFETGVVDVGLGYTDVRARYHVWGRNFFAGLGVGQREFSAKVTESYSAGGQTFSTTIEAENNSMFVYPHIGWYIRGSSGFLLQFELGYQNPLSTSSDVKTSYGGANASEISTIIAGSEYQSALTDVEDQLDSLGNIGLPVFVFLGLGWLF